MSNPSYIVTIEDLNSHGEGVCRLPNGQVCFVPHALPGEEVRVEVSSAHKGIAEGTVVDIINTCRERRSPECSNFPECGGCELLHLHYDAQCSYKLKHLRQTLQRIGKIDDPELIASIEIKNAGSEYFYRNNARYHFDKETGKLGFFRAKSRLVAKQESFCLIVAKPIDNCRQLLEQIICENRHDLSTLQSVQIRYSQALGELGIVFGVNNFAQLHSFQEIAQQLICCNNRSQLKISSISLQAKNKLKYLYGKGKIAEKLNDIEYIYNTTDFFQINTTLTELIMCDLVQMIRGEEILDLYCGSATITLQVAKRFPNLQIQGIEVVDTAVEQARQNARLNKLKNAKFISQKAEDIVNSSTYNNIFFDTIIVDPPRRGLDKSVADFLCSCAKNVIYMSCNPATLARDLVLLKNTFRIEKITAYDMFPQTMDVETVCLMTQVR